MPHPILIRNVEYDGSVIDVLVSGGVVIPAPEVKPADAIKTINARGLVASPGPLVDLHVHFRDPGLTEKEDFLSGARAAAAGGISVVACEPNTRPVIDNPEAVTAFRERVIAQRCPIGIYTKGAITRGQAGEALTDFPALVTAGVVGFSDDGEPVLDRELLVNAFRQSAGAEGGLCLTAHCEETPASAARVRTLLGDGPALAREAEIIRLHLDALARAGVGRLHVQHVSLAASVALIADAKQRGLAVTAEVTPHHLLLCAEDIPLRAGEPDPNWKMNPPLRSRDDMLALRTALANGVIDIIATDHAPHRTEEKAQRWTEAPFGVIGLETALSACLTLVHDGTLTLARLFTALGATPWNLLPRWAQSRYDSITLIDPQASWTVEPDRFFSKGRNTPFAGRTFRGKAVYTIARGRIAMADGEVLF